MIKKQSLAQLDLFCTRWRNPVYYTLTCKVQILIGTAHYKFAIKVPRDAQVLTLQPPHTGNMICFDRFPIR